MAGDPGAYQSIIYQVNRLRSLQGQDSPSTPPPVCVILGHSWARNLQSYLHLNAGTWNAPHFDWAVEHVPTLKQALGTHAAQRVAAHHPAVVVLMLGGNDIGRFHRDDARTISRWWISCWRQTLEPRWSSVKSRSVSQLVPQPGTPSAMSLRRKRASSTSQSTAG